jgi:CRP/FNR family transcriptional regulator, cyclic AMP receptor protein
MENILHQQLSAFLSSYPLRTYKKGEIIVFQGEAPRTSYVISSGVIKAYNLSLDGDEKPVAFYSANDIFPEAWSFGLVPSATYYFEALTKEVKLHLVEREVLMNFIKADPSMLYSVLERQVKLRLSSTMHINALQYSRASDKLLYSLHFLCLNLGDTKKPGELELELNLTHQDLANLTGLTRETTAMELNKLKRSGVISYGPRQPYKLHLNKMASMINDQYIKNVSGLGS